MPRKAETTGDILGRLGYFIDMKVEVVNADYQGASTCFHTLPLPAHYTTFSDFSHSLEMCIATNEYGFGLLWTEFLDQKMLARISYC